MENASQDAHACKASVWMVYTCHGYLQGSHDPDRPDKISVIWATDPSYLCTQWESPRDSPFNLMMSLGPHGFVYNTLTCQPISGLGLISSLAITQYTALNMFSSSFNTPHTACNRSFCCTL